MLRTLSQDVESKKEQSIKRKKEYQRISSTHYRNETSFQSKITDNTELV